ncbi:restriction endonuclease [Nitrososphaera viennensis]|nr:restriction endonuclease [Nitrososphaera viennensis]
MSQDTTLDQFCRDAGIASRSVARSLAEALLSRGIGRGSPSAMSFSPGDRLAAAALALEAGCDPERVSQHLTWRDFEQLAAGVLASLGYSTRTNVRFTKPRMELDVVGTSAAGLALAVDCKHWKRSNLSSISQHCARQAKRADELLRRESNISAAVPVVMTLHAASVRLVGGMPVVPVAKFHSFAMDVRGFLDEVLVVTRGPASR